MIPQPWVVYPGALGGVNVNMKRGRLTQVVGGPRHEEIKHI